MYDIIHNVELIHITKDVVNIESNIFKDFFQGVVIFFLFCHTRQNS